MGMADAVQGSGERRNPKRALGWAVGVAVFTAFSLVGLWWGWLERTPSVNIPKPQMPAENAHYDWNAATTRLNPAQEVPIADALLASLDPPQPFRGKKRVSLKDRAALVESNQAALARFRKGLTHPYLEPPARSPMHLFPHLSQYRSLARLLRLEGQVRAGRGDWNGAMRSSLDTMQMGMQIPHGNPMIGQLVGIAIQSIGRTDAWAALPHLSGEEARTALHRLAQIRADEVPYWKTLEEEKWLVQASLLEIMRKPNWRAAIGPMLTGSPAAASGPDQWLFMAQMLTTSKISFLEGYTSYMDQAIAAARQPSAPTTTPGPLPTNTAARMLVPVFNQARFSTDRAETLNALLHLALALRVYRHDRGAYPVSLQELAPHYVRTLPSDPFAGGRPFRYRRTAQSFQLYSVGPDRKDDGGQPLADRHGQVSSVPGAALETSSTGDIVVTGDRPR